MLSCHIFKSLSHFEHIFVFVVKMCSNFIDLHEAVQHCLLKRLFSHCIVLPPLWKIIGHRCVSFFLGCFVPLSYVSFFVCEYHGVLITVALQSYLKFGRVGPPPFSF